MLGGGFCNNDLLIPSAEHSKEPLKAKIVSAEASTIFESPFHSLEGIPISLLQNPPINSLGADGRENDCQTLESISRMIFSKLWKSLGETFLAKLWMSLGGTFLANLWKSLGRTFLANLWTSLGRTNHSLRKHVGHSRSRNGCRAHCDLRGY